MFINMPLFERNMADTCALCAIHTQDDRVVERGEEVYSIIPHAPLAEGHVMILPYRHARFEELTIYELLSLRDMAGRLKDRLMELDLTKPPMLVSMLDTRHASIPDHFHYHLIPSEVNMRKLLSHYDSSIPENRVLLESELERMARQLRT